MQAFVAKWGNSLALRLPRTVARELDISEGTPVELRVRDDTLTVIPKRRKYRLDDLLAETSKETTSAEVPWGGPAGDEVW